MTWVDLSAGFAYGTKLTSTQMQQLRDNIAAAFAKDSGAPQLADDYVVAAMFANAGIDSAAKFVAGVVDQSAVGASAIGQGELKKTSALTQVTMSGAGVAYYSAAIGGGSYAFGITVSQSNTGASDITFNGLAYPALGTSLVRPKASFTRTGGTTAVGNCNVYYIQASGELHWIFLLMKAGEIVATWEQPDHPCFGNMVFMRHPFDFPFNGNLESECEIILVIPTMEQIAEIRAGMIPMDGSNEIPFSPTRLFTDVFFDKFEIQESKEADWPDVPVTIGLPRIHEGKIVDDWRLMPRTKYNPETELFEPVKVSPIKMVIDKPDNVTVLEIKKK